MANLFIDYYGKDLVVGCCTNLIYAVVYNQSSSSLKEVTPSAWSLQAYLDSAHDDHALLLTEHSERSKYYLLNLDEAQFTLADTPDGEEYTIEIWKSDTVAPYVRADDTLLETQKFTWHGQERGLRILPLQQTAISGIQSHIAMSYDSDTQTIYYLAWLEKAGIMITDTTNCNVRWRDRTGSLVTNINQSTHLTDEPGVFSFVQSPITPNADETTVVICSITDADSNVYSTTHSVVTWD